MKPGPPEQSLEEFDLVDPALSATEITAKVSSLIDQSGKLRSWKMALLIAGLFLMVFFVSITYLLSMGVGIWGIHIPVAWGFAIINFVWWVGIGHAGTFISAILVLVRQDWRNSINRFAEAMTLFAVAAAGTFPILHMGRPWFFYWLFPYPNSMDLYPQYRSPLVWDAFAITSYGLVSLIFWYLGLVPDLATLRDRAEKRWKKILLGIFALGWRGSAHHWFHYEMAYLLLAGLATPLVLSVHSIVAMDFAVTVVPGWHSTIFPPYFVAGAIFSGFAMVVVLAIPLRRIYGLESFITIKHLENCGKLMLVSGLILDYSYLNELFMAWYGGNHFEWTTISYRLWGEKAVYFWIMMICNLALPQLLWWKKIRTHIPLLFFLSICILIGMWLERYVIVITSLERDYLPSTWSNYGPTQWDISTYLGSMGLFFFCFLLFLRILPVISMSEMKKFIFERKHHHGGEK